MDSIKRIIDSWDPIGLLALGCPEDEYSPEIREIEKRSASAKGEVELAQIIRTVFTEYFGEDVFRRSLDECRAVALAMLGKEG